MLHFCYRLSIKNNPINVNRFLLIASLLHIFCYKCTICTNMQPNCYDFLKLEHFNLVLHLLNNCYKKVIHETNFKLMLRLI